MALPNFLDAPEAVVAPVQKQMHGQILERLQQHGYTLRQPDEVVGFLTRHSSLLGILDEAPKQIHQYFGETLYNLILEIVKDPEAEDDEELILFIPTNMSVDKALQILERVDNDWWLEKGSHTQGNLGINLEFYEL
jgi:hypothetical protein